MAASKVVFLLLLAILAVVATAPPAAASATSPGTTTCVPTMQRLLSCLDFIEHRSDVVPPACCAQLNATVAEQPCCLMHVVRGNVAHLLGPEFDTIRAMVNVTTRCLGDGSILMSIARSCSGQHLPPLTPEYPFTTGLPAPAPPQISGATRLKGWSYAGLSFAAVLLFLQLQPCMVIHGFS